MELRQLRYFVAVAETLHFGNAARRLRVSQPPLSQQISALERELGVKLLTRTSHHVELTEAGRLFLPECREVLANVDRATALARRTNPVPSGPLRIGFVAAVGWPLKSRLLAELLKRHPAVVPILGASSSAEQLRAIRAHQLDVGLIWEQKTPGVDESDLARLVVREDPIELCMARNDPLAHRKRIPVGTLADQVLFLADRAENPQAHDAMVDVLRRRRVSPKVQYATGSGIIDLVAAGFGVSFITAASPLSRRPDIVMRPFSPPLSIARLVIVWQRDNPAPTLRAFTEIAHELSAAGQLV
jgi:DNA-binding transcriptional LysR family regulator